MLLSFEEMWRERLAELDRQIKESRSWLRPDLEFSRLREITTELESLERQRNELDVNGQAILTRSGSVYTAIVQGLFNRLLAGSLEGVQISWGEGEGHVEAVPVSFDGKLLTLRLLAYWGEYL